MGKTSFLHHLQRELASQGAVWGLVPVFVDLEATPAARLSRVLMEETVETLALQAGTLGLRLDDRNDGYRARDLVHDVKRVVRDVRARARADARLVFLVDEVDAVLPDPQADDEPWLDTLLEDCSEELRVVLAGVTGRHGRRVGPRRERGRLEDLVLEPLRPDEARALVTKPVAHCFRYDPRAVDRIVQLAKGRPYLLQKLCLNALNRMLDEGRSTVRLADVESTADFVAIELPRPSAPSAAGTARSAQGPHSAAERSPVVIHS